MRRAFLVSLIILAVILGGAYVFVRTSITSDLVRSTLEQQLAARLGQSVRIGSAGVSVFPRATVDLRNVSIGTPEAIRVETIRIATGLRGLLSRQVAEAEIVVAGSHVTLPLPFPLVANPSPSSAPASSSPGNAEFTVASVRVISLRDLVLTGGKQTLNVDVEASLDGDRLEVRELTARAERTRIRATGTVSSLAKLEASLEAVADPLDLDELIAIGSAFAGDPAPGAKRAPVTPMHVAVKLTAPQGQFATYRLQDLASTIDIAPARVTLAPLSLRTFGGRFAGRLDVDSRQATPQLRLTGKLDGLDVAELMKASGSPGGVTGKLGGSVSLSGQGSETDQLLQTSRGNITAAVTDGSLPNLDMVRAIVLAFGKPSGAPPEGSGSAFSRLGGDFTLANGVLASNSLAMASRDFDMSGSGSLRLASSTVDARADVALSEELTSQAGTDLRRYAQQDGRVIVPVAVSGTLQQPTVTPNVVAAMQRAVGNELKRRATSIIEGLFKKK
jgi:uncharacterized protein involved in outer membrane biogenesis